MEEVVVTARRIEERAQDVPISMTVFNQQQLTERNVTSGVDLATYTPSLSTNSEFGSEGASFAIRGVRQEIYTTASVAVYFADVVAPRGGSSINSGDGAGPGSFFDLQNVQVLKGPQGTLFGRNTDGGAILLVPNKPTSQLEGYVDTSYGNYDMLRVQGVANLPVNDQFRMRFGVDHENRDGYLKNISGIGPSNFNDINYTAARVSAVYDITPTIENYTIASLTQSDHNGVGEKVFACNAGAGLGPLACLQTTRDAGADYYTVANDNPKAESRMQQWQIINTTSWQASDTLTVKNIVSYAQLSNYLENDLFGTDFPLGSPPLMFTEVSTAPGMKINDESTTTEEVQLQGHTSDNKLVWQAGAYTEFNEPLSATGAQSPSTITCTDSASLNCVDLLGSITHSSVGSVDYKVGKIRYRDLGIYEQSSYNLTDTLKFTEGLRYTMDRSAADVVSAVYQFPAANTPVAYCASSLSPNFSPGFATPVASPYDCPLSFTEKSQKPTWVLGLDYKPMEDLLTYIKYSRGYREGSVSPYGADGDQTYKPEKVDTYEIGTKTGFNTFIRGTFDVDAFYNDFSDQQISVGYQSSTGSVSPNIGIINAGKSRIWGLEVESNLVLLKGLTLDLSYAYLNSKLESLALPTPTPPYDILTPTAVAGGEIPLTPKNKATATLAYVLPVSQSLGRLSLGTTYTYTSGEIQTAPVSSPYFKSSSYELVNLNFDWKAIGGSRFDAGLFATNVFDKKYTTYILGLYNTAGFESESVGEPRMYGGHVRINFGS